MTMNRWISAATLVLASLAIVLGTASCGHLGSTRYGEQVLSGDAGDSARYGVIQSVDRIRIDDGQRFGVGSVIGVVAGGILGSTIGQGTGRTLATAIGAVAGGVAGANLDQRSRDREAQRVSVTMGSGGQVTILQPVNERLQAGMAVRIEGSGESARVLPR